MTRTVSIKVKTKKQQKIDNSQDLEERKHEQRKLAYLKWGIFIVVLASAGILFWRYGPYGPHRKKKDGVVEPPVDPPTDPPTEPTDPPTEPTDPPIEPTDPPTTNPPPQDIGDMSFWKVMWIERKYLIPIGIGILVILGMFTYALIHTKRNISRVNQRLLEKEAVNKGLQAEMKRNAEEIAKKGAELEKVKNQLAEIGDIDELKASLRKADDNAVSTLRQINESTGNKQEVDNLKAQLQEEKREIKKLEEKMEIYEKLTSDANGLSADQSKLITEFVKNQGYIKKMAFSLGVPDRDTVDYSLSLFNERIDEYNKEYMEKMNTYIALGDMSMAGMSPEEKEAHKKMIQQAELEMGTAEKQMTIWTDARKNSKEFIELEKKKAQEFIDKYGKIIENTVDEVITDVETVLNPVVIDGKELTYDEIKRMSMMDNEFFATMAIKGENKILDSLTLAEELEWTRKKQTPPKKYKTQSEKERLAGADVTRIKLENLKDRELFALYGKLKDIAFGGSKKTWMNELRDTVVKKANALSPEDLEKMLKRNKNDVFRGLRDEAKAVKSAMGRDTSFVKNDAPKMATRKVKNKFAGFQLDLKPR